MPDRPSDSSADRDLSAATAPPRLGLDVYSLRSQGWSPFQHLDFCASRGLTVLHFSEIRFLGGVDPDHLHHIRAHADGLGIDLEVGMRSICPSSTIFDASAGSADEQLTRVMEVARQLGSPLVRCVLGRFPDRKTPGGIEQRIADTVRVLKSMRSLILDSGLKLAIENHAGDMQARELKQLVEDAGPDFVGVCLDSGNPLWALEDPHLTLETLAPYVLTSHIRDGVVWPTPEGVAVAWTRMGEGRIGIDGYLRGYVEKCPGRPLSLEIIVSDEPRFFNYREREFWSGYGNVPAAEFVRFLQLAERGAPVSRRALRNGELPAAREIEDIDESLRWTREQLAAQVIPSTR